MKQSEQMQKEPLHEKCLGNNVTKRSLVFIVLYKFKEIKNKRINK